MPLTLQREIEMNPTNIELFFWMASFVIILIKFGQSIFEHYTNFINLRTIYFFTRGNAGITGIFHQNFGMVLFNFQIRVKEFAQQACSSTLKAKIIHCAWFFIKRSFWSINNLYRFIPNFLASQLITSLLVMPMVTNA